MSVMDKLINAMKFNDDQYEGDEEMDNEYYSTNDYDDDDRYDDEAGDTSSRPGTSASRTRKRTSPSSSYERDRDSDSSAAAAPHRVRHYSDPGKELRIIRPKSIDDARTVSDILLRDSTVILNLEGLDVTLAQRIIDFTSGACYAVDGHVMKISHYIFVVTPADVDVSGDISNQAGENKKDASVTLKMPVSGRS